MEKKNYSPVYFCLFIAVIAILWVKTQIEKEQVFWGPHTLVCATITRATPSRGNIVAEITYTFNNVQYKYPSGIVGAFYISKEKYKDFQDGKTSLLIVLLNKKPTVFFRLENEEDFTEYNININDTIGVNCR